MDNIKSLIFFDKNLKIVILKLFTLSLKRGKTVTVDATKAKLILKPSP